jgi:hypothetical protein
MPGRARGLNWGVPDQRLKHGQATGMPRREGRTGRVRKKQSDAERVQHSVSRGTTASWAGGSVLYREMWRSCPGEA